MAIKWSEQNVIDAFENAMTEAASMPSPQQMIQDTLMSINQEQAMQGNAGVMNQ
jgi:hypothetical protein